MIQLLRHPVGHCAHCGNPISLRKSRGIDHWSFWFCNRGCRMGRDRCVARAVAPHRAALLGRVGATCWLCSGRIDLTVKHPSPRALECDHVIPVSRGGSDELDNLRPAHAECNRARGADLPAWFRSSVEDEIRRQALLAGRFAHECDRLAVRMRLEAARA